MAQPENWIAGAVKHPGALHKALHVPQGKNIPPGMLAKSPNDSPQMARRKALARILKGFHGGKNG